MNILITGNNGYIGPILYKEIKKNIPNSYIYGFDNNYFFVKNFSDKQLKGDLRNFPKKIFDKKIDIVIHLASLSNDPIGNSYEKQTKDINVLATKKLIDLSKKKKCKLFIFASSCSVYGKYGNKSRTEKSKTQPLTAYAKSKIVVENYLKQKADKNFKSVCLRFATACGASPNLRLDLVLNDFVFRALTQKKIILNSSGNAWRPLIDVRDMSKAILCSIQNFEKIKKILIINTGSNQSNFRIIDLAKKVSKVIKNTTIVTRNNIDDKRSYKVDFSEYNYFKKGKFKHLSIDETIFNLVKNIKLLMKSKKNLNFNNFVRLKVLEEKIKRKKLNKNLKWI